MKPRQQPRHAQQVQRSGKEPRHARPSWAQIHLGARIQHLDMAPGRTSPEAEAVGRQPTEPHRPPLADLEIEP